MEGGTGMHKVLVVDYGAFDLSERAINRVGEVCNENYGRSNLLLSANPPGAIDLRKRRSHMAQCSLVLSRCNEFNDYTPLPMFFTFTAVPPEYEYRPTDSGSVE
jgi:hypothetical protein